MYEVNFEQYTSWYGEQTNWNYISNETAYKFYQTQYEKYWDYSAYPYRFHAVSPAPVSNGHLQSGFVLNDKRLYIPTPYQFQTCTDGETTAGAEPCMIAQVERRNTTFKDFDLLAKNNAGTGPKEINDASASPNRYVALPFHHINSKIRFAIYCPEIGEGDTHEVKDVTIKVRSNNFITSAIYEANLSSSTSSILDGSFTNPTKVNGTNLIEITSTAEQKGHDLYNANDKAHAYWFECEEGLMQIPQTGVQMSISFKVFGRMENESVGVYLGDYTEFTDVPIILQETGEDTFNWEKGNMYTYYIVLGKFRTVEPIYPIASPELYFTCTVEPWDFISGSFNVGLED